MNRPLATPSADTGVPGGYRRGLLLLATVSLAIASIGARAAYR
jgi:hypothetical protein